MEVLTVLSGQPGRVVSRDELLEKVWPDVIVTEHTLSRCIYQLRHELGKIGGTPGKEYNPIETLPKRGYRLLANVETLPVEAYPMSRELSAALPAIPFVVGQWVRGERFYGRSAQIEEILNGHRNCIWLLGTRRIGKTSLLKQIEYIAETSAGRRYFPIFWDFQGAETPEELHLNFGDALIDADERLERIGIGLKDVEAEDLFVSIEKLRRRLRAKKLGLLLLCDEVEELIKLHRKDPSLLNKLRHLMQSREDIRTVLASTIRLWVLAEQKEDTSPFLHGFTPPLYIARFSDEEARSLIEQSHLDPEERPRFEDGVVEAIREHCDNHPYLVQLVCKRYLETGALEEAIEQVATDRMVSYFFSVDFEMSALMHSRERCVAWRTSDSSAGTKNASSYWRTISFAAGYRNCTTTLSLRSLQKCRPHSKLRRSWDSIAMSSEQRVVGSTR
jgi:DNA-binding winged helix-turn-helix (wHTH) protein